MDISATTNFELPLSVESWVSADNTYMVVNATTALADDEAYTGTGVSKRNPADDWDPELGFRWALLRALRDLATHMEIDALRDSGFDVVVHDSHTGERPSLEPTAKQRREADAALERLAAKLDREERKRAARVDDDLSWRKSFHIDSSELREVVQKAATAREANLEAEAAVLEDPVLAVDPSKPNHFVTDSLGDPETCTGNHNHPRDYETVESGTRKDLSIIGQYFSQQAPKRPKTIREMIAKSFGYALGRYDG